MYKNIKKLLLTLTTLLMLFTSLPCNVFADELEINNDEANTEIINIEEENNIDENKIDEQFEFTDDGLILPLSTDLPVSEIPNNNLLSGEANIERDLSVYQNLIDVLPESKWINELNIDMLRQDLAIIDNQLLTLSDEDIAKLNLDKYNELSELANSYSCEPMMLMANLGNDISSTQLTIDKNVLLSAMMESDEYDVILPDSVDVTNNETSFDYQVTGDWSIGSEFLTVDVPTKAELVNGDKQLDILISNSKHAYYGDGEGTITLSHDSFPAPGTWTCDMPVSIKIRYQTIMGVERSISSTSPSWTRIDDSAELKAKATKGDSVGSSDFDDMPIYKDIKRVVIDNEGNELSPEDAGYADGNVMVKIPKFYYRRYQDNGNEIIELSSIKVTGFETHPAFVRKTSNGDDTVVDYIYVGAYKVTDGYSVKSGLKPLVSKARKDYRNAARTKASDGHGWSVIDVSSVSAIQMLILVEYADNDVQTIIGRGYVDGNSASLATGTCDEMYNAGHVTGTPVGTAGKVDVIWRGIEGFWGNVWEWTDGLNFNGGTYYVCNDIYKYKDDTADDYTALSYTGATNWSTSYIKEEGLDPNNSWAMMPSVATGANASTYYTDAVWSSTGWRVLGRGGRWDDGSYAGLFASAVSDDSSYTDADLGSRFLYLPLQ